MDKLKYIKLENEDGSYSDSIPLAVDANYVDVNGSTLTNALGTLATKTEVQAIASGSPAGVYSTITSLTAADPDHSKIYLVTADGHWYYYNNGWQDGGVYQGTSINENDNVITDLYNFLKYSHEKFIDGKTITTSGTTVNINNFNTEPNWACVVATCNAGDIFTLTGRGGYNTRLYCFIDSEGNSLLKSSPNIIVKDILIEAPENSSYIIININKDNEYYFYKGISKEAEGKEKDFLKDSIFNNNTTFYYPITSWLSGAISTDNPAWITMNHNPRVEEGQLISVTPGDEITLSMTKTLPQGVRYVYNWVFYKEDYTTLEVHSQNESSSRIIAPMNAAYVAYAVSARNLDDSIYALNPHMFGINDAYIIIKKNTLVDIANAKTQCYVKDDNIKIEEDTNSKKLYIQMGMLIERGITDTQVYQHNFETYFNRALETSPSGLTNCLVLNDMETLAYDFTLSKFVIKDRTEINENHLVILAQNNGLIVEARSNFLKNFLMYNIKNLTLKHEKLYSYVQNLTNSVIINNFIDGKTITTSGTTVDINNFNIEFNWACAIVECQAGDIFTLTGRGGDNTRLYCFINEDGDQLEVSSSQAVLYDTVLVAPEDSKYLIVNVNKTLMEYYLYKNIPLQWNFAKVNSLNDILYNKSGVNAYAIDYILQGSLNWPTNSAWVTTGNEARDKSIAIPIKEGQYAEAIVLKEPAENCHYVYNYLIVDNEGNRLVMHANNELKSKIEASAPANSAYIYYAIGLKDAQDEDVSQKAIDFKPGDIVVLIEDEIREESIIPEYWQDALAETKNTINSLLDTHNNMATFGFVTDVHIGGNKRNSSMLLEDVMETCHIPLYFDGGDCVTGSGIIDRDTFIKQIEEEANYFKNVSDKCIRIIGNHDVAYGIESNYDHNLSNAAIYNRFFKHNEKRYEMHFGPDNTYFYIDNEAQKIRYIGLNILNYESQIDENEAMINDGSNKLWGHLIGNEQLQWLSEVLNVDENWGIVIATHCPLVELSDLKNLDNTWQESLCVDTLIVNGLLNAYINKTTYSYTGSQIIGTHQENYNLNCDFSNYNGDLICCISGHTHKDCIINKNGVINVNTANDSISMSNNGTTYVPNKTAGTDTEHVLDFFCIDKENRKGYVIRLGAYLPANGKIRTFNY